MRRVTLLALALTLAACSDSGSSTPGPGAGGDAEGPGFSTGDGDGGEGEPDAGAEPATEPEGDTTGKDAGEPDGGPGPGPEPEDGSDDGGGECLNECTQVGAKQCTPANAVQVCGNWDADDCLEWTEGTPCQEGASCSGGVCSGAGCKDECTTKGAKQCAAGGFQTCGDFDDDECLEYGNVKPCGEGETCSGGECASECVDECTAHGAVQCQGDAVETCGHLDADPCLEWSDAVPCEEGETCSAGACAAGCEDECTEEGAKQCQGNGVQACGNHDGDACLEWSTPVNCPGAETCSSGACSATCTEECSEEGVTSCAGNGVQTCGLYDADLCLEWGTPVACPEGETCSEGSCKSTCTSACSVDGAVQCEGAGVVTCGDFNADGCLEWGSVVPCGQAETCSNGKCDTACTDECGEHGETGCSGNGVQTCGHLDADPCLEWGTAVPCEDGESCSAGACVPVGDCEDECDGEGSTVCGEFGVLTCGNADLDPCLEYGTEDFCELGEVCDGGACLAVSGDLSCGGVFDCIVACGEDGECALACFNEGTTTAQDEFLDLDDCAAFHGCDSYLCFSYYCAAEVASCAYDATGASTCAEIAGCFDLCDPEDDACFVECVESGSPDAQADLVAWSFCLTGACGGAPDEEKEAACIEAVNAIQGFCGIPLAECLVPDDPGAACLELFDCAEACGEDQECLAACLESGSPLGVAEYSSLNACAEFVLTDPEIGPACEGIEALCLGYYCGHPWAKCLATSNGELSCVDIFGCAGECPEEDDACVFECLDQGTQAGQELWIATFLCLDTMCGEVTDPAELELCLADAQQDACADVIAYCQLE